MGLLIESLPIYFFLKFELLKNDCIFTKVKKGGYCAAFFSRYLLALKTFQQLVFNTLDKIFDL